MTGDEVPKGQTITISQIRDQGIAALNLIYGAFDSLTKQNEEASFSCESDFNFSFLGDS